MLQGNIDIFQITGKEFKSNGIEYSLHKPINYLQTSENKILIANQPPFDHYQVGDYLGISVELVRHQASSAWRHVFDDRSVISKVLWKPPQYYTKQVINSEEFGDGWVEE